MNTRKRHWMLWVGAIALVALVWTQPSALIFSVLKSSHEHWVIEVQKNCTAAALLFVFIAVMTNVFALVGVAITSLAAGALFGAFPGWALAVASASIGATGAFLISRYFLGNRVKKRFSKQWQVIEAGVRRDGTGYLMMLRLVPFVPAVSINLLMGMTSMSVARFFVISLIGMMPGAAFFAVAGSKLSTLGSLGEVLSLDRLAMLSVLGLTVGLVFKRVQRMRRQVA